MGCVTDTREVWVLIQFEKPRYIKFTLVLLLRASKNQKKSITIHQSHFNSNMFYALHTSDFKLGLQFKVVFCLFFN